MLQKIKDVKKEIEMKIAYLILCHKNPIQVNMLIDQLTDENVDFYIHVDAKANHFVINKKSNVFVLDKDECVDIQWASFSMISATLNLICKCLLSKREYEYIFLISGQDFPIKTNRQIFNLLETNKGKNFIEILPKESKRRKRYRKRIDLYYPKWMYNRSFSARLVKRLYIYLTGGYFHTFRFFKRRSEVAKDFEFGSQWWCLQKECLSWMMDYINAHPSYVRFYKNSLTPDESFFQTLFSMSPYIGTDMGKLTFLEWDKNRNNPRLILESDVDKLIKSKKFYFARKFDNNNNPKLINQIIDSLSRIQ